MHKTCEQVEHTFDKTYFAAEVQRCDPPRAFLCRLIKTPLWSIDFSRRSFFVAPGGGARVFSVADERGRANAAPITNSPARCYTSVTSGLPVVWTDMAMRGTLRGLWPGTF